MSPEAATALAHAADDAVSLSNSPTPEPADDKSKKRSAPTDGAEPPHKVTKRRAARACVSCRARKVRCDVVEGAPCGNCRWDNVEVCNVTTALREALALHFTPQSSCTMRLTSFFCLYSASSRRAAGESE